MAVVYGISTYVTISNIWFLLSALNNDILWIRFYLLAAYVFLFIGGWTNFPPLGTWHRVNSSLWSLGALIWPFFTGSFHLYSFLMLLWDERRVKFSSDNEEQLYRMVYRRSGMGRLEFKHAMKLGRWMTFEPGQIIYDSEGPQGEDAKCMHILVDGTAELYAKRPDGFSRTLQCGYLFDLAVCNIFGVYIGLERSSIETVVAETHVLLVRWEMDAVECMADGQYPALAAAWRNFILYSVGAAFSGTCGDVYASNGEDESQAFLEGGRSRDMTDPWLEDEEPQPLSLWQLFAALFRKHNPIIPPGLRHNSMPTSGMLARGRILASRTNQRSDPSFGGMRRANASEEAEANMHLCPEEPCPV